MKKKESTLESSSEGNYMPDEIDLLDILLVLMRQKGLIVLITACVTVFCCTYSCFITARIPGGGGIDATFS